MSSNENSKIRLPNWLMALIKNGIQIKTHRSQQADALFLHFLACLGWQCWSSSESPWLNFAISDYNVVDRLANLWTGDENYPLLSHTKSIVKYGFWSCYTKCCEFSPTSLLVCMSIGMFCIFCGGINISIERHMKHNKTWRGSFKQRIKTALDNISF